MKYFGTDGIRGVVGEDITHKVAFCCGNAVASLKNNAKIIVGTDTRVSADFLFSCFASGATLAGANIFFVGIVPTPAISFLVQKHKADFGVMITASHNPATHNGIKIFDKLGEKIGEKLQAKIEALFDSTKVVPPLELGKIFAKPRYANEYVDFVAHFGENITGLKVVLDASNGASGSVCGKIFKKLGATVKTIHCKRDGKLINKNCGALHPQNLARLVKKLGFDIGFAFDGDADRVVMVDSSGRVCDGDQILLFLASAYKKMGLQKTDVVVATVQSNAKIEQELEKLGLRLVRTDVGDHFVERELKHIGGQIGGEQCGHIILFDHEKTGDGVFCAVQICKFLKIFGGKIDDHLCYDLFGQVLENIETKKKHEIVNSAKFRATVLECEALLAGKGRIVCRPSGTENKIRILVECDDKHLAKDVVRRLREVIESEPLWAKVDEMLPV